MVSSKHSCLFFTFSLINITVDYSDHPKDEENYVKIRVDIPKLKKKFMKKEASNAEIKLELDQNVDR